MADRRRRRRRASQDSDDEDGSGSGSGSGSDSGRSGSPAPNSRGRGVRRTGSPSPSSRGRDGRDPESPPEAAAAAARAAPAEKDVQSECESEDDAGEAVLSDYDSADPEDNGSHSEGVEEEGYSEEEAPAAAASQTQTSADPPTEEGPGDQQDQEDPDQDQDQDPDQDPDEGVEEVEEEVDVEVEDGGGAGKEESKAEEKENLAGERQSGDGQESTDDPETKVGVKPGQRLDDDEDRKNPAYIPRKGLFFEHDVRGHPQEEERPKGRNRKLWKDEGRWEHDKFREEEQAPKSREELIAIYGYDIRNGGGGGGGGGERTFRQRRPRPTPPHRDQREKRWGAERPGRSWQAPPPSIPPSSSSFPPLSSSQQHRRAPPPRSRPPNQHPAHPAPAPQYRRDDPDQAPGPATPRDRQGPRQHPDLSGERGVASRGGRGHPGGRGSSRPVDDVITAREQHTNSEPSGYRADLGPGSAPSPGPAPQTPVSSAPSAPREASPPPAAAERPVERKSYSAARRTRSRPSDLGSKQASVDEANAANAAPPAAGSSPSKGGGAKSWAGGEGAGLADLDQDVARLNLARQGWSQNPTSYVRSEMRGLPAPPLHLSGAPPPFSSMEEMGVGSSRAKRYSSQRQRAVPEPAPPLHLGVMEGHYYDPMSYQGPIYTHGEGPAPIPPQGMLVQPEMHLPHPGLHPHQSGGPITSPALYGGPPVSLSPGQPQQLLPAPFYPPPGVVTFPYPAMYPSPPVHHAVHARQLELLPPGGAGSHSEEVVQQVQQQVTYGGVTYYDTMQQQQQPKPSPPRRTSQPVTVKPPPPEVPFASE
ncbi:protein CASC3 isoform X2 [Cololabis saira]|uniref:protein CASC3 isoform X2 n=1 Tax=Cololabis saira TaxID=129043 RepID=UPI002AD2DF26|nr:protein CASC3 isoform X2 [Cololabis saira]